MRWIVLGLFLLASAARAEPQAIQAQAIQAQLAQAMDGKTIPAMGALVIRDFKVEGEAERGVRRMGEAATVQPGDLWHLGSDGKAMTATLIARLVERGTLSWTAPLWKMLPDLAAQMRPEYRDVTLFELLSHRAGLGDMDDKDPMLQRAYADTHPLTAQRAVWVRRFLTTPPAGPIRGPMKYSNEGPIIAGYIAERATGRSYERLMAEEVFGPLGMTSATAAFQGPRELTGHVDGRVQTAHDANPDFITPAGGWRMTLADWARFCIDQMAGEQGRGRLLIAETYRTLHTAQGDTVSALGWGAVPRSLGRQGPALTHAGSDGNWYAVVVLFPTRGSGVLVTANAAESLGGDKASGAVARALAADLAPPAP